MPSSFMDGYMKGKYGGGQQTYAQKVRGLFGSSLIQHLLMDEPSGLVSSDKSGNGCNGAYTATDITYQATALGRTPGVTLGGSASNINLYSAAFASKYSGLEGTIFFSMYIPTARFANGADQRIFMLRSDGSNRIFANKDAATDSVTFNHTGAGTSKGFSFHLGIQKQLRLAWTWSVSSNRARLYICGQQYLSDVTGLGNYVNPLTSTRCLIGAEAAGANMLAFTIANWGVLNREATPGEMLALNNILEARDKAITVIGDSNSVQAEKCWDLQVWARYANENATVFKNHAVSSSTIMPDVLHRDLETQVTAAANDNADVIIIALGTNDDNAGDMAALKAKITAQVNLLKASNPRAVFYWLSPLKRWTDNTGATEVDKSNIRTAIAEACTANGITYWDSYTDSWITAADTTDGLHPIADYTVGFAKIAARVLALLP